MAVVHTYFYSVIDKQRGCRTLKIYVYCLIQSDRELFTVFIFILAENF